MAPLTAAFSLPPPRLPLLTPTPTRRPYSPRRPHTRCPAVPAHPDPTPATAMDSPPPPPPPSPPSNNNNHNHRGDGSGGSGGGGEDADEARLAALLTQRKMSLTDLPGDVVAAYEAGTIPARAVWNYILGMAHPLGRLLVALGGDPARARLLADHTFLSKIIIEQLLGVCGKMTAEFAVRRDRLLKELDFVMSDLVTALMADFVLVYFPGAGWWRRAVQGLPTNVFQMDRGYTLGQRLGALGYKSAQLAVVGCFCALAGFAMTNLSIAVRERMNPGYKHLNEKTDPLRVAMVYSLFLGTSSNARYQIVGGIENNLFPVLFRRMPKGTGHLASTVMRFVNTSIGAGHWIFFVRSFGMMRSRRED